MRAMEELNQMKQWITENQLADDFSNEKKRKVINQVNQNNNNENDYQE